MADWQTQARQTAQRVGVDPDLYVALIRQESGGNPAARSPAGAYGYAQLTPGTAKQLGVNINDPAQNLYGGAVYLKQQLKAFGGDTSKALAAYNAGPGAVQKYGGIPPFAETQNYVKSILGSLKGSRSSAGSGHADAGPAGSAPPSLTGATPGPGQSADASALISLLASRHGQAPDTPGPANLPTPAAVAGPVLPQAYRALSEGQAPAPKADISSLLSLVQTPGQSPAPAGAVSDPGAVSGPPSVPGGSKAGLGGFSPHARPGDPVVSSKQSEGGEHATAGLAGYPAHDFFAPAGTHAVAPVSGTVVKLSGHDPSQGPTQGPHGPLGWSVYIKGDDGKTYFLTHMGSRSVKVGQKVGQGQIIGTVADYDKYGTPSHIHLGVNG